MSDWYYAAENTQKGPVNEAELKVFFATDKLPLDTLVWKDGMDNWTPANQLPAFSFRTPPSPAAVQPGETKTGPKVVSVSSDVNNPESAKPVDFTKLLGPGEALEVDAEDAENNKVFGILAYLGFFCFVPIIVAKDSPFARYHANQGLILFIAEFATTIITWALVGVPIVGLLFYYVHIVLLIVFLVAAIYGIINAAAGKCVPLPYIGGLKLLGPTRPPHQ